MRLAIAAAASLLLAGCSSLPFGLGSPPPAAVSPSGLSLVAQPQSAGPGGTASLAIQNATAEPVGYNLCFGGLEHFHAGIWIPALTPTKACEETFSVLPPGQQATAVTELHPDLPAGQYRYVSRVASPLGSWPEQLIRSNAFSLSGTSTD